MRIEEASQKEGNYNVAIFFSEISTPERVKIENFIAEHSEELPEHEDTREGK